MPTTPDDLPPRTAEDEARIAAAAHLSSARALVDCAREALEEARIETHGQTEHADALASSTWELEQAADVLCEPLGLTNVLQTVEEALASGAFVADPPGQTRTYSTAREPIIRALVIARATEDETRECDRYCILQPGHEPPCKDEPTDDEIYNRPGMEGGIGYPIDHDARRRAEEDTRDA
jgi:hypothetical protein